MLEILSVSSSGVTDRKYLWLTEESGNEGELKYRYTEKVASLRKEALKLGAANL